MKNGNEKKFLLKKKAIMKKKTIFNEKAMDSMDTQYKTSRRIVWSHNHLSPTLF